MKVENELRKQVLDYIATHNADSSEWDGDVHRLIEELLIYQIELETQYNELVSAQDESRKLNAKFEDLFENAPIGYVIVQRDGCIKKANKTFCAMLGVSNDNLVDSQFSKLVTPLFQDTFHHFFRLLQKNEDGISANIEMKLKCMHKRETYVRIDGCHLSDSDHYRMTVTNISMQKMLEMQLRNSADKLQQSETKFRQIVESSTDVFLYQNVENKIFEYLSPNVEKLLGFTAEEIMRFTDVERMGLLPSQYRQGYANFYKKLTAEDNGDNFTEKLFQMRTSNGNLKWIKGVFVLERKENGTPSKVVGCLRDVSLDKRREIDQQNAKELAVQVAHLKSVFWSNISKEMCKPLETICKTSNMLLSEVDEVRKKSYVDRILRSKTQLSSQLADISSLSKLDDEGNELVLDTFDLSLYITNICNIMSARVPDHVEFICDVPVETYPIVLDKIKMTYVLNNLISNAINFTPKGSITVGFKEEREGGVCIYVSDTGVGIPKDKQNDVFNCSSPSKFIQGTGLGLAIAKQIVEAHNGIIGVDSVEGKGSTFWMKFPKTVE